MLSPQTLTVAMLCQLLSIDALQAQALAYHHRSTALGDSLAGAAELTAAEGTRAKNWADAYSIRVQAEYDRANHYEQWRTAARQHREQEKARLAQRRLHNLQRQQLAMNSQRSEAKAFANDIRSASPRWPLLFDNHPYRELRTEIESAIRRYQVGADDESSAGSESLHALARRTRDLIRENPTNATFANRVRAMRTVKLLELLADPAAPTLLVAVN